MHRQRLASTITPNPAPQLLPLQVLKWLLDAGCPVHNEHPDRPSDQALHMACYQGYGPEAVKLLVAAGADPFRPNKQRLTPIAMTANQVRV